MLVSMPSCSTSQLPPPVNGQLTSAGAMRSKPSSMSRRRPSGRGGISTPRWVSASLLLMALVIIVGGTERGARSSMLPRMFVRRRTAQSWMLLDGGGDHNQPARESYLAPPV